MSESIKQVKGGLTRSWKWWGSPRLPSSTADMIPSPSLDPLGSSWFPGNSRSETPLKASFTSKPRSSVDFAGVLDLFQTHAGHQFLFRIHRLERMETAPFFTSPPPPHPVPDADVVHVFRAWTASVPNRSHGHPLLLSP